MFGLQAAQDIRADPLLWESCEEDAKSVCKDVKMGSGRVQACLVGVKALSSAVACRPVW